jgi:hypothetical protein
MRIAVTDLSLTAGAIREAAEILNLDDLRRACEYALRGRPRAERLPNTEEGLREVLTGAVESLRDSEPEKLTEIANFIDGIIRQRVKEAAANSRRSARGSAHY